MPTSSSRRQAEFIALNRHNERFGLARERWPNQPICPDCYRPLAHHTKYRLHMSMPEELKCPTDT